MYRLESRGWRVMPAGIFGFVFCRILCAGRQVRKRDSEGVGKVFGGFVEVEFFEGSPEIEHVSLDSAVGVEAAEDLTRQVGGELSTGCRIGFVNRTRAAVMDSSDGDSANSFQNLLQRQHVAQYFEVDRRST